MVRVAAVAVLLLAVSGCGIVGPSCIDQQARGQVFTLTGDLPPGQMASHRVSYETRGSQNDVTVSWTGDAQPDGPRIAVHATRAGCTDFRQPAVEGACSILASAGWINNRLVTSLVIANGRGNPDILGSPAEYRLWIVGDPQQRARYTVTATWFYGPDC
jgi:hypothetical protein